MSKKKLCTEAGCLSGKKSAPFVISEAGPGTCGFSGLTAASVPSGLRMFHAAAGTGKTPEAISDRMVPGAAS